MFNNDNIIVYSPTTFNGSKYYGQNSKWCTAINEKRFDDYMYSGSLYIIQSMHDSNDKYQLFILDNELVNTHNKNVDINTLIMHFNDNNFTKYLYKIVLGFDELSVNFITAFNFNLILDPIIIKDLFITYSNIVALNLNYVTLQEQENNNNTNKYAKQIKFETIVGLNNLSKIVDLKSLVNLKHLIISDIFNEPIGDLLLGLTNLESLTFGSNFNQPLGNSLRDLINLKQLNLGGRYNKPLDDSLSKLINLQQKNITGYIA
jgi:hypothetical protein